MKRATKLELVLVFTGGIAVLAVFNAIRAWRMLRDYDDACDIGCCPLDELFRPAPAAPPIELHAEDLRAELDRFIGPKPLERVELDGPRVEGGAT